MDGMLREEPISVRANDFVRTRYSVLGTRDSVLRPQERRIALQHWHLRVVCRDWWFKGPELDIFLSSELSAISTGGHRCLSSKSISADRHCQYCA